MNAKSKIKEDLEIEIKKIKDENTSLEEKTDFAKEHYLKNGCEDNKFLKSCGGICSYKYGCVYKSYYNNNEEYCLKYL